MKQKEEKKHSACLRFARWMAALFGVFGCLPLAAQTEALQVDSLFFCYVDTTFDEPVEGHEIAVGYYTTADELTDLVVEPWDTCAVQVMGASRPSRLSQSQYVNGQVHSTRWTGRAYTVRLRRAGRVTLPGATALVDGRRLRAAPWVLHVQASMGAAGVTASFSTRPAEVRPGECFYLTLTLNRLPDAFPELEHPGLSLLSSSNGRSVKEGVTRYTYTYLLRLDDLTSCLVYVKGLTFGGEPFAVDPYLLRVEGGTML